jgi:hypothetical protein
MLIPWPFMLAQILDIQQFLEIHILTIHYVYFRRHPALRPGFQL